MKKYLCFAALVLLSPSFPSYVVAADAATSPSSTPASASSCEDKAVDKNGKKLAGAAKASFLKKCEANAKPAPTCEDKAVDKNGKKLAGAAKESFMKKCEANAKSAK